jgi:hypothetical protein
MQRGEIGGAHRETDGVAQGGVAAAFVQERRAGEAEDRVR